MRQNTSTTRTRLAPEQRDRRGSDDRFALRRLRTALLDVIRDAAAPSGQRTPEPVYPWHDLSRGDPRGQLPCTKERAMLHAAIQQGCTTRAQIIAYRAQQLLDDFRQFPDEASATDVTYVEMMVEVAEAIEAQTVAHGLPTVGNIDAAIRESRESIGVMELECRILELYPRTHVIPMGRTGR